MNYYKEVLDICSEEQNWKQIVIDIAKVKPKAVFDATHKNSWEYQVRIIYNGENGSKDKAIKYCRQETGMSLYECKLAVEALVPKVPSVKR